MSTLQRNTALGSLSASVFKMLEPRLHEISLRTGRALFSATDSIKSIYFPISGAVSLLTELRDGHRIETAIVGRDDIIGGHAAFDDHPAGYTAIVQIAGSAYSLPADVARQTVTECVELRRVISRHEQLILALAQQQAACNATHNLDRRLARWLLRVRDVTGSDTLLITQELMAEMLGVGRTTVSMIAQDFQKAGLVSYRRGHVTLERVQVLRSIACECYEAIQARYDSLKYKETAVGHN